MGAIDRGRRWKEVVPQADLVFLSQTIGRHLIRSAPGQMLQPGALVTDAGSTKCEIVDLGRDHVPARRSFWAHPMAARTSRRFGGGCRVVPRSHQGADAGRSIGDGDAAAREFQGWLEKDRRAGADAG